MPLDDFSASVRAITTAVPPTLALVMNALLPLSIQTPSRSSARVRSAAASEPEPGSVSPHAPSTSPRASGGRYFTFCAGEPNITMWLAQRELCAHMVIPTDASPRFSSSTRSEEHTSELQSLAYLVCRLLLEKKKNQPPCSRPRAPNAHDVAPQP